MSRRASRPTVVLLGPGVVLGLVLALGGCGLVGEDDAEQGTSPEPAAGPATPEPERGPAEIVMDSVEGTAVAERLAIDSQASLQVGDRELTTYTEGAIDYPGGVYDLDYGIDAVDGTTEVGVVADGSTAWLKSQGPDGSTFPGDATWLEGDVADLSDAEAFTPLQLMGSVLALRAAEDVTEVDPVPCDGVECRVFTLSVGYEDAVDAAAEDAPAFEEALSLDGPSRDADLDLEVAVGPDDVIRRYTLDIVSGADVGGGYEIVVSGVGEPVETPLAPDPTDTASGPEAAERFARLVGG